LSLSAGAQHSCILVPGGGVDCWGENTWGELGYGQADDSDLPVGVVGLSSGISMVSAGGHHACAATTSGAAMCWGEDGSGELGDNGSTDSDVPVAVVGQGAGVAAVASGGSHVCALTTAGRLWCWGSNSSGQLGDGTTTDRHAPVAVLGF
jgi:alpha-tubulin suppressor-like RCC1 family protein